ncbi:hypothetical protein HPB47_011783 [Ixodes persulcatus]|uniref:Uncharacterized protein n=1 Tax=Ixodes persulcatus TaxID=34615 RepID=A0AC60NVD6_IXOPE|nr:hypothetical protein HPB47_011783 [Ixodes persulcatus]
MENPSEGRTEPIGVTAAGSDCCDVEIVQNVGALCFPRTSQEAIDDVPINECPFGIPPTAAAHRTSVSPGNGRRSPVVVAVHRRCRSSGHPPPREPGSNEGGRKRINFRPGLDVRRKEGVRGMRDALRSAPNRLGPPPAPLLPDRRGNPGLYEPWAGAQTPSIPRPTVRWKLRAPWTNPLSVTIEAYCSLSSTLTHTCELKPDVASKAVRRDVQWVSVPYAPPPPSRPEFSAEGRRGASRRVAVAGGKALPSPWVFDAIVRASPGESLGHRRGSPGPPSRDGQLVPGLQDSSPCATPLARVPLHGTPSQPE